MTTMDTVRLSQIQEIWESFSGWYWFVTEYHEGTLAFGLVRGWEIEWGYFDLSELRDLETESKVWRVPRRNWAFCPGVIDDALSYSRVAGVREAQEWATPVGLPVRTRAERRWMNMADEYNNKDTATLVPTKAGRGFKVVVDGTWFYTSKASLLDMVNGKAKACTFATIKDEQVVAR